MTETATQLVGHVINSQYRLLEYLGNSEQSAVFLTEYGDSGQKAAIKLIAAHPEFAEGQLSRWELASQFPHVHLIQLLDAGRCDVGDTAMLYVVMEYAPENLSQVLAERALTAEETSDVLDLVLEVLGFLHSNGFVLGHLKPSNILAIDDQLKFSSDSVCRFGEAWDSGRQPDAFDAPEIAGGKLAAPADLWSLGTTLVEALTQRLPTFNSQQPPAPIVPDTLAAVFRDIAENCLLRDPECRWTVEQVSARVRGISPVMVPKPESKREPEPEAEREVRTEARREARTESRTEARTQARYEVQPAAAQKVKPAAPKTWRYVAAMAAAALVLAAIFAAPKLLHRSSDAQGSSPESSAPELQTAIEKPRPAAPSSPAPVISKQNAPANQAGVPSAASSHSAAAQDSGGSAVVHKVLPTVSDRARATIRGTVLVVVRVEVDSSGNVVNATLDPAGPSKYFGDLSLQAAHDWKFRTSQPNGQPVPSQWFVSFLYTQTDTTAFPTTTAP
jgi:TonB family protein